jgi:putative transposase
MTHSVKGALYHVTSRGDGREDIFLTHEDRLVWLQSVSEVCARFNWVCHAYCQMTNRKRLSAPVMSKNSDIGR